MKNNPYFKLIVSTVLGAFILINSCIMMGQQHRINTLEDDLYVKHQAEERATDFYSSTLNLKTIRTEFNELQDYTVLKGTINQDHTYDYSADAMLGLKKEITIKGHGKVLYSVNVRLSDAIVTAEGKNILVQIRQPEVDNESINLQRGTLVIENTDANFIANKEDGMAAQKFFIESFVDAGVENVNDLYKTENQRKYINEVAKAEVEKLIQTLNLNDCNVRVKIIE